MAISSVVYACQFLLFKKKHLLGARYLLNTFTYTGFFFFQRGTVFKVFIELVGLPGGSGG